MKNLFCLYILFTVNSFCFSQDELTVEFNMNKASYRMGSLNEYLQDTFNFYNTNSIYLGNIEDKKLMGGFDFNMNVNYQAFEGIGLGMFLNLNSSVKEMPMRLVFEPYPGWPDSNVVIEGKNFIASSAYSIGASTRFNLDRLFDLNDYSSKIIKSLDLNVRLMGGVSHSRLEDRIYLSGDVQQNVFTSNSFHGKADLGFGYRFGKVFNTTIGVRVGYQYLKTKDLRNVSNSKLEYNSIKSPQFVSLDFSGMYYGFYISVGK